jgi:hypothetical protein
MYFLSSKVKNKSKATLSLPKEKTKRLHGEMQVSIFGSR